jgi:hypothetical protein
MVMAHPDRSAYGYFLAFSAHIKLIGRDNKGSIPAV